MTKILGILIIAVVVWAGYEVFEMWDKYDTARDVREKEAAANHFAPEALPGMPSTPSGLEEIYRKAQSDGAIGVRNFLKAYGAKIEDPRRACIELDYVVLVAAKDPVEAKKVFADVKERTPANSPIYFRIKQLEKTYD